MTTRLLIDKIDERGIEKLLSSLRSGEVIGYPTDTIYGFGVDVYNSHGVEKLLTLKGRNSQKPISILYPGVRQLLDNFNHLNSFQKGIIAHLLPGQITVVLPVNNGRRFPAAFVKDGSVGTRVLDYPKFNRILSRYPNPVSTTSINLSGKPPMGKVAEILSCFDQQIAVLLDAGDLENKLPSTVIKLFEKSYKIIREGAISRQEIEKKVAEI